MPGRLSIRKKTEDRQAARYAAYAGAENPFEPGTRRHRYFITARAFVEHMDQRFAELEQVYGQIGTALKTSKQT